MSAVTSGAPIPSGFISPLLITKGYGTLATPPPPVLPNAGGIFEELSRQLIFVELPRSTVFPENVRPLTFSDKKR